MINADVIPMAVIILVAISAASKFAPFVSIPLSKK